MVRVNFQGHISRGRSRLHSLVILKPGLHPAVVQLLRWLVQNQLEVDFDSPVLSKQLDKAGSSFALSPKALAGLADPASTSHSSLFRLQFPGTDTAEDEPAIGAAPKGMDSPVAVVLPLVLGAAYGHHVLQGELWVLTGARSYRSRLQSLRFQRSLQEAINLCLGVAQTAIKTLRLLMANQGNPP